MIIQESKIKLSNDLIKPYLARFKDSLFFDIETTGLYWKNSHLYLIGTASFENSTWTVRQCFLDRPFEEAGLLDEFTRSCRGKKRIVHYNGSGFDIPYLQRKYAFYRKENPFADLESLDVYRISGKFKNLFGLKSMKLKSIEQFLNLNREDIYSGKELIQVYTDYLRTKDHSLLDQLMLHNREDISGLIHLLPILGYEDVKKGIYTVQNASFENNIMTIRLQLQNPVPAAVSENFDFYDLSLDADEGTLKVSAKDCIMKHFFPDYKDYYYLPMEDQAIHKSVGAFVDHNHREKARASTCYQKQNGVFLPQLKERFQPVFFEEYKSKPAFFPFQEELLQDKEKISLYTYDFMTTL